MKLISNNKRVRIIFQDNRIIEGLLLACDFHMNTIISKSVEYRLSKESKKWEKRKVGICIIRGNSIATISFF
jgi:small nuclear ribonucleoprotein (snRNP)-like protein